MSRLKELRLHGFKTFADPTRFVFDRGVTAVIGPNGSGKSNMADAVRWVLGEQSNRSLRTRKADEVIFAGSQQRRPLGMAEAVLVLDNADRWLPIEFGEVSIGRRAYRSGEGEYLLNGARVRLREITRLLGEGRLGASDLVVVGQGTVDAALSLRAEERRQLFEEAAGVKALQVRKNESLARLDSARDNLTRVRDLIAEIRPQVRRLALQAAHQERHDRLTGRLRAMVMETHRRREADERRALDDAARRVATTSSALEEHRQRQAAGERNAEEAAARYWEAEARSRGAADERELTREAVIRAEARVEALDGRISELEMTILEAEASEREAARLLEALRRPPAERAAAQIEDVARAAEADAQVAVEALEALDQELAALEDQAAVARQAGASAARERWEAEEQARRNADRLAELERDADETRRLAEATALGVEAGRTTAVEARIERDAAATAHDAAQAALSGARRSLERAEASVRLTGARIDEIEQELQEIAGTRDANDLISGLLAAGWPRLGDRVDVPEEAVPAVVAVLGGSLEEALVATAADVAGVTRSVQGVARGVATFETAIDPAERSAAAAAVQGSRTLAEWIGADDSLGPFARTIVAPDVDALLRGWAGLPAGWSAVTERGDLASSAGVIVLLGTRASSRAASAARGAQLTRELAGHRADAIAAQQIVATAQAELALAEARHGETGDALRLAEATWRSAEADAEANRTALGRARRDLAELEVRIRRVRASAAAAAERLARPASEPTPAIEHLESRLADLRHERERRGAARNAARRAALEARSRADELRTGVNERERDRAALEARIEAARAALPARRSALRNLMGERASAEAAAEAARRSVEEATRARTAADTERERLRALLVAAEQGARGAAGHLAELEQEAQQAAVEMSRREDRLAGLRRELELAVEGTDDTAGSAGAVDPAAEEVESLSDEQLDAELPSLRRTLAQVGAVNPFAQSEHRELSGRLDDLSAHEADLDRALESTTTLIEQLESEIAERFAAAFQAIGERFDEFVRVLFDGGSASLHSGEPQNGQAPAIEIAVRPPGKRLQRLEMLSGGERALAGVALLFAMLSVNPVPFCILDEVDAALDEANVTRFVDALRRLASTIDFVVITHNRATIEMADAIYGVTMTDAAASRVVSVRLSEVPLKAAV